jgi:programmed cell death protein 5
MGNTAHNFVLYITDTKGASGAAQVAERGRLQRRGRCQWWPGEGGTAPVRPLPLLLSSGIAQIYLYQATNMISVQTAGRYESDGADPHATAGLTDTTTEARKNILDQILHPEAADRLGRIRLVKEQRATEVENRLIMLAQTGQLRQKVTEEQLKELLNAVADNKDEEKIVVNRRKGWDDEDDDLLDL